MVSNRLPCLSRPQVATLALWSLGIILMQSAGLTTVTACIALLLGQAEPTVRERLRYWYRARTIARDSIVSTVRMPFDCLARW
jgi:hypothetical protein